MQQPIRAKLNTSSVSLGLLVVLEVQTYHNVYRSATNRSRFVIVFNILRYQCKKLLSLKHSVRAT